MTYSPNIPLSTISPAASAPEIQTNFSQFQTVFSENHTKINNKNQGDHEDVILTLQTSDPGVTQDLTVLYCKNAPATTGGPQPQLFVQIPQFLPTSSDTTTAPNAPMQLTYNTVNTSGPNQYQSFLPGGYILYLGTTNTVGSKITLVPQPTKILIAIAEPNNVSGGVGSEPNSVSTTVASDNTGFTIRSNASGSFTFCWMAIAQA